MMNEQIATLGVPSWIVGIILPVSAALSILSLYQSLKIHRDIIAANEINF
jgi:TRAP-type C4-dicarboxylate transport system permease small subunit